jgi:hypothetical protein
MGKKGLTAKVIAVNRVNTVANDLYPKLVEAFKPYVGQKLFKAAGGFLKKIEEIVPSLEYPEMQVYRHNSEYNIAWTVKTSEQDGDSTSLYYSTTIYIGNVSNGVLTDIMSRDETRTDFTVEEIQGKQRVLQAAQDAYNKAKSALFPFEERDRNY